MSPDPEARRQQRRGVGGHSRHAESGVADTQRPREERAGREGGVPGDGCGRRRGRPPGRRVGGRRRRAPYLLAHRGRARARAGAGRVKDGEGRRGRAQAGRVVWSESDSMGERDGPRALHGDGRARRPVTVGSRR